MTLTQAINTSPSILAVVAKVMKVARDIGAIQKKKMEGGNNANYGYFANETIMAAVSEQMDKNNLWIIPSCASVDATDVAHVYHFQFMVVDADTGEYMTMPFAQSISGGQYTWNKDANAVVFKPAKDQTAGIADSYAYKNFVLKLFGISTPDADTEEAKRIEREAKRQEWQDTRDERTVAPKAGNGRSATFNQSQNTNPTTGEITPAKVTPIADEPAPTSDERFDAIPSAVSDSDVISTTTHKALMAELSQMKITDMERHVIIDQLTAGAKQSSKDITYAEYYLLRKLLKIERMGRLAGVDKWQAAQSAIALKVSEDTVTELFGLNSQQAILAHGLAKDWLIKKAKMEVPAQYATL